MRRTVLALAAVALALVAAGCRGQGQVQTQVREQPYVPDDGVTKILAASGKAATKEDLVAWIEALGGSKSAAGRLTGHLLRGRPSVQERRLIADILDGCDREDPVPGLALLAQDLEMGRLFRSGMVHLLSDGHGCPQSVAPLVSILKSDPVPEVRVRAASELASLYLDRHAQDFKAVSEALLGALADKDEIVRDSAAWGLGCLAEREPGLVERIEKLKEHEDANVRAAAAEALRNVRSGAGKKARGGEPGAGRRGDAETR